MVVTHGFGWDSMITPHSTYTHLGKTHDERVGAYRRLFETQDRRGCPQRTSK